MKTLLILLLSCMAAGASPKAIKNDIIYVRSDGVAVCLGDKNFKRNVRLLQGKLNVGPGSRILVNGKRITEENKGKFFAYEQLPPSGALRLILNLRTLNIQELLEKHDSDLSEATVIDSLRLFASLEEKKVEPKAAPAPRHVDERSIMTKWDRRYGRGVGNGTN